MANILFITSHLPFPPLSGGRRREYELLRRLTRNHNIEVCAITRTLKYDRENLDSMRQWAKVTLFESPIVNDKSDYSDADSFLMRRNAAPEAAEFVASRLDQMEIDLVHCEGYYMFQLVGRSDVPIMLMEQNIEFLVWPEAAERIRAEEVHVWRSSTCCGAVTEDDADVMRGFLDPQRVLVSFDGTDHLAVLDNDEPARQDRLPKGPIILCPGNFGYWPSFDAGTRMCTEIGPDILRRFPTATVVVVGNEAERLTGFVDDPRIVLHGRVPSLEPYYAAATVVVCPMNHGRGIKVKILEALARGCAIVTSDVGAQGLHDAPLVIGNSRETFVNAVVQLLIDEEARTVLQSQVEDFASTLPTWDAAAERLNECWQRTIQMGSIVRNVGAS